MKHPTPKRHPAGYISYLMVITLSAALLVLMTAAYRRAMTAHSVQTSVQLRIDYREKEEAVLRAIVAITPNRAIRAMQDQSATNAKKVPLRWQQIFSDALILANARQSISEEVATSLGVADAERGNSGDSALGDLGLMFRAPRGSGAVTAGINSSLGSGYPVPLTCSNGTASADDASWPIITNQKIYAALAQGGVGLPVATYPNFNLIAYPDINFGYAQPGQPFVAKRNWWAFSVELSAHDASRTYAAGRKRDFVLSIYEIPSQLAISAPSFMALGEHASGAKWENTTIDGGIFTGRAAVAGDTAWNALATRRGADLASGTTVGGWSFVGDPLAPGVREAHQLTDTDFFPVSLASESGRAAFIPLNRGADYLDRFAHGTESDTISPTTWNNYSVGALQCAMQLDITKVTSATNKTPTELRFSYLKGGTRKLLDLSLTGGMEAGLPVGYIYACVENASYNFGTAVVDVAYGKNGTYAFQTGVTDKVAFNNARFGDPLVGVVKNGYFRPSYPFEIRNTAAGKICLAVYPQRFATFLTALGADGPAVNHSLAVNVDYTAASGGTTRPSKPSIPSTDLDYGVILEECSSLVSFPKGFSLVTNLRLYYGDDFNVVPGVAPQGYDGTYYPPCSMFAAEQRFGIDVDPFEVALSGQVGSLVAEDSAQPSRPLDAKTGTGNEMAAGRVRVNLRPITHPADLPPITMMNWLVLLEERKTEYHLAN